MNSQYTFTPAIWPSILTIMLLSILAAYAWRRRNLPGALWFVIYCLLALPILAFHVIEYLAVDLETKIFWFNVEYPWWLPGTTAMTCFILAYAWPRRWTTRRTLALMFVVPVLGLAFTLSNDFHHLLFRGYGFDGDVDPQYGPAGWAFMAYNWGLRVISTIALVWLFVRSPQHRWPAVVILLAETFVGVLLVVDPIIQEDWLLYVPWKTVPVVACAIALFGFRILDPIPLARQTVIEQLQAGMLVLDLRGRVINLNPAAERILNASEKQVKGKLVKELMPAYPEKHLADSGETEIEYGNAEGTSLQYYMLTNSMLYDFRGLEVGRLLLLRDVTEQKRVQAQLLERLSRLHEASSQLISTLDLDQTMVEITRQAAWLLRCQKAGVIRLDMEGGRFDLVADFGFSQDERQSLLDELPGWVFLSELVIRPKTLTFPDERDDLKLHDATPDNLGLSALLITPIWTSENPDEFIFTMESRTSRRWSKPEVEQIEGLANRAAIAIVSANLHHQRQFAAALEERQRIAANMHDGLAQTVSLLGLKVDQINENITQENRQSANQKLTEIRDIVDQVSTEVRLSIATLQSDVRPHRSLQDVLGELVDEFRAMNNEVTWSLTNHVQAPLHLPDNQREQLVPVVREALSNAYRHAQANQIEIALERYEDQMQVIVQDDGQGFGVNLPKEGQKGHFGLKIMRARAARMGGCLQVDSVPGNGTRITLNWPLSGGQKPRTAPINEAAIPSLVVVSRDGG